MLKHWISWIFKIPQIFVIRYKKDGKKILIVSRAVRGEKTKTEKYLVEHLLDDELKVTEETLSREKSYFNDLLN